MNVLVINCGSSSLKYQLIDSETEAVLAKGLCERIGIDGRLVYHIVSEGVETQEEMEQISSWGVEMIQGYYFSKPLPEKELLELLKKQDNIER